MARAAPDGYTFLVTVNTFVMNQPLYKEKLHYDPIKDFMPVSLTSLGHAAAGDAPRQPRGHRQAARRGGAKLAGPR